MNVGRTVFAQVMDFIPMHEFHRCVTRYDGSYKVQSFSCWDHFLSMAFAQLTYREGLRDIEACLRSQHTKLYHMGLRTKISRSTLSYANNSRSWHIYADFAHVLIATARELYRGDEFGVELTNTVYALDSTTIDLCLSLFPWAHFRTHKAGIKLHTLLNLRGNIPSFLHISDGIVHDVNILDTILPEPGSVYIMDRAYVDFERLHTLTQVFAYFVTRAKSNLQFKRLYSHAVDKALGTLCDQTIQLTGFYSAQRYPDKLRRIKHYDAESDQTFVFLTNNFLLPSITIAQLYKCRWQIELFFKWIKQHLRIKAFYGTSENAVKTQIWIAVSVYVLVAIIKKRLKLDRSLYTILQILSISLFEKVPLAQALTSFEPDSDNLYHDNQMNLFTL
ncbi:MAG: IS4 family transposase [Ignavibacteriae bacterium]|nr:IS4 family transposase [Ignavibacteriota bacterium]